MNTIKTSDVKWLSVKNPSKKDLEYLKKTYKLHPVTLQELLTPTLRPRVEEYDNYLYMVLHFPIYDSKKQLMKEIEIDFIILKDTLITVHYETLTPMRKFWASSQVDVNFRKHNFGETSAFLLCCSA